MGTTVITFSVVFNEAESQSPIRDPEKERKNIKAILCQKGLRYTSSKSA